MSASNDERDSAAGLTRISWLITAGYVVERYGPELGPLAIAVYVALARHADAVTGRCFPSHNRIAMQVGMSRRSVIRQIAKLALFELVEVKPRHRSGSKERESNEYFLK